MFYYKPPKASTSNDEMLHRAVAYSDTNRVYKFLQQGADPNHANEVSQKSVVSREDTFSFNSFAAWQAGLTPLHVACSDVDRDHRIIEILIDKGAHPDIKNKVGGTPLMHAASAGHISAVIMLTELGADLQAKSYKGNTALDIARREGATPEAAYLEQAIQVCHPVLAAKPGSGVLTRLA